MSNLLLPVSNRLVRRSEDDKLQLSGLERTRLSGRRTVKYKTYLPSFLGVISNRYTLAPLHWLQKACGAARSALVLYFEASPGRRTPS
jgi:hypothetical protein